VYGSPTPSAKRHLITFSFDDGFLDSCMRIASIYEKFKLSACFNVLASNEPGGKPDDIRRNFKSGDFVLWNELAARGHEVMPHGWNHTLKTSVPFEAAKDLITRCLDKFAEKLSGFDGKRAVFNFPYNASTPELEAWLPNVVRAFRTRGDAINPLPSRSLVKLGTAAFGPGNSENHCDAAIKELLARGSGWLIYNLHGLDSEGWGPVSAGWLERTLDRLTQTGSVTLLPAARALSLADLAPTGKICK
jgi:peptidoglycan/xylan/chitin deacetylase (PgdA/CDA1 family)